MPRRRRLAPGLALAALCAMQAPAHAHGAVAGANSFYAGLFHPFQNLPQLLVLVGLGLLLGQRCAAGRATAMAMPDALPGSPTGLPDEDPRSNADANTNTNTNTNTSAIAIANGGLAGPMLAFTSLVAVTLLWTTGLVGAPPMAAAGWLIGLALCCGVLVASAVRLPGWLHVALAAAAAVAIGLDSGVDGAPPAATLALILLGTWLSTSLLVVNIAWYVSMLPQRRWVQVGIRVAGSWMAAASVLVLAFYLKGAALG